MISCNECNALTDDRALVCPICGGHQLSPIATSSKIRRRIEIICALGLIAWFVTIFVRAQGTPGLELLAFLVALVIVAGWIK